jgi:hypothetical protein
MLAPVALYPDELLVQVLMAATYPLEVVQAFRWVQANAGLGGDQFAIALEQQGWDPSVKSLVNFPSVLQMMNDRLDWTQRLGDAFLGQCDQVMDTVQQLRERAQAQGNLRTTSEQRVIMDPQTRQIIVEPAAPQVVYVPVYDPMIVYGPWWWPAYRPYYYHPRGVVIAGGVIGFGVGVAVGLAWGYAWGGFNWHRHDVVINVTRNVHINNRIDRNRYASYVTPGSGGQGTWRHDPDHRRGVAYRAPSVAQQYGRGPGPGVDTRRDYRGFDRGGAGQVAAQGPNRPAVQPPRTAAGPVQARPEPARQPSGPAQQPRVAPGPPVQGRPEPASQPAPSVQQPRVAPSPVAQARSEPARQAPAPAQQPRVAPSPPVARPEPATQPAPPVQQPRVAPSPAAQARPEPARQPSAPGRQAVQGVQGPTAFGGSAPVSQTPQFSNRGHESLSGTRTGGAAPSGNKAAPGSEGHGGAQRGGGNPGSPQGGGHGR